MRLCYLFLLGVVFSSNLQAFPCFLTIAKDSCWTTYEVTVRVIDMHNNQQVATVVVPSNQPWGRVAFQCESGQVFLLNAQFSPLIWQSEAGRMYASQRYWSLPNAVKPGEAAWNLSICYAKDFAGVPMPPTSTNNCRCDWSEISKPTM